MARWTSICLLGIALLQGLVPADQCLLKLAGLCNCGEPASSARKCCCCEADGSSNPAKHNPSSDNRKNPCCAYTPAHALTAIAPGAAVGDTYQESLSSALLTPFEGLAADIIRGYDVRSAGPAPSPQEPLFLRVHTLLI
jgi:hypothetical protein